MTAGWTAWAATSAGSVRTANEDAFVDRPDLGLWAVADGAGGHQHGEVASSLLQEELGRLDGVAATDLVAEVRTIVSRTHWALRSRAEEEAARTGAPVMIASTLVLALVSGPYFACLWAGDSRAYLLRAGVLTRLTRDHSLVQELIEAGTLSEAEAETHPHANIITRAIGAAGPEPELDKITGRAAPGDRVLLCSDGLFKAVDESTVAQLMNGPDPAQSLIAGALDRRARDNVTAVVLAFQEEAFKPEDETVIKRPA